MDLWLILTIIAFALTCFYFYITWNNNYWNKRGIPNEKPAFFFGNFKEAFKGAKHFGILYSDLYKKFGNSPYVGVHKLRTPAILIRDLDLIKSVLVKDFPHFPSNDFKVDPEADPIFAAHVFAQTGEQWKKNRSAWTVSVTSSKIKNSFDTLNEKCDIMIQYIKNHIKEKPNQPLEPRELSSNFFTDAVVSGIFGLEVDSFKTKDNPYRKIIKSFFIPTFLEGLITLCFIAVPWLAKILKLRFVPKHVDRELQRLADEILQNRQITGFQKTNSFDSILLHERNKNSLTRIDVAGLILGFLIDGTETSSGVAGFMLYALATNPHVQTKLRAELDKAANANDGKLDYDTIHSLQYLDMVLSETLRLYPPGLHLQRLCAKEYTLPPPYPGGKPYTIPEGMTVVVPIYGLQMDPEYFPEPEKFDPERFSDENKGNIVKYSYLPFGEGPRVCLGARFALNQTKIEIGNIIRNFEIRLAPKMEGKKIEIDPNVLVMRAVGDLWVTFHNRTDL